MGRLVVALLFIGSLGVIVGAAIHGWHIKIVAKL